MSEKTHVDPQVGCSVFGVSLINRPPAHVRASISKLQGVIEAALPGGIAYRLEALRRRIEESPSLSGLNGRRPGLQHVSLFRYAAEMPLEQLRSACRDIDCDVPEWRMAQMDLVRETVYPSLCLELLQSFGLAEASIDDARVLS